MTRTMNSLAKLSIIALVALPIGACSSMSRTERTALTGGAIGAAAGAGIAAAAGGPVAAGALIGAAAGATSGAIYEDRKDRRYRPRRY